MSHNNKEETAGQTLICPPLLKERRCSLKASTKPRHALTATASQLAAAQRQRLVHEGKMETGKDSWMPFSCQYLGTGLITRFQCVWPRPLCSESLF